MSDYISFLEAECGLNISLHPKESENLIHSTELMLYNTHKCAYCLCLKQNKYAAKKCRRNQTFVYNKVKRDGAFCGTCYAGIKEYVYPIIADNSTVGFISVSGYKSPDNSERIKATCEKFGFNYEELSKIYQSSTKDLPSKKHIDTLIVPLCNMLELAYIKLENLSIEENNFTKKVCRYIAENYSEACTSKEICRYMACSRSYLSHTFKNDTGKSLSEYITEIRIKNAKRLLNYKELNITQISLAVGYNNSNYFSNVFKEHVGVSPGEYRRLKYRERYDIIK